MKKALIGLCLGLFLVVGVKKALAISWSYVTACSVSGSCVTKVLTLGIPSSLVGGSHLSTGDSVVGHYLYADGSGWIESNYRLFNDGVVYDEIETRNFVFNRVGNFKIGAAWRYSNGSALKTEVASGCIRVFNKATGVNFEPTNVRVNAGSTKTKVLSYNGKALGGIWGGRTTISGGSVSAGCTTGVGAVCSPDAGDSQITVGTFNYQSSFPTSYTLTLSCSGPTGSYCDFDFGNMNVLWRDETSGTCTGTLPPLPNQSSPSPTPTPRTIWRSCTFCDANRDGKVCKDDLTILNSCYGYDRNSKSGSRLNSTCNTFDMNYDGKINIQDLTRCGGVCASSCTAKPTPILDNKSQSTTIQSTLFVPITTKRR